MKSLYEALFGAVPYDNWFIPREEPQRPWYWDSPFYKDLKDSPWIDVRAAEKYCRDKEAELEWMQEITQWPA